MANYTREDILRIAEEEMWNSSVCSSRISSGR